MSTGRAEGLTLQPAHHIIRRTIEACRLAKEAADRDATNREIATAPPRGRGRQPNHPTSNVS